ncbi:MAG: hypothetical protein Q7S66_01015 [bacterium]|nr:hypothetical protein [bacterium]
MEGSDEARRVAAQARDMKQAELSLDIDNPEQFIEQHFSRREEVKEVNGLKYRLIEFRPESQEVRDLVKHLQFFLFGGNGNVTGQKKIFPHYFEEWLEKMRTMDELIQNDPDKAVEETRKAIALVDGLLRSIGKESIIQYFTHTIYGENNAYATRASMEKGANMERVVASQLNSPSKERWILSQLSPYTPSVGIVFLKTNLAEQPAYEQMFDEGTLKLEERGVHLVPFERKDGWATNKEMSMEMWRRLHALAYQRIGNLQEPIDSDGVPLNRDGDTDGFSVMKEHIPVYSGTAQNGWTMPAIGEKMVDITDMALVTGKEFHEEGVFKFIIPEHGQMPPN